MDSPIHNCFTNGTFGEAIHNYILIKIRVRSTSQLINWHFTETNEQCETLCNLLCMDSPIQNCFNNGTFGEAIHNYMLINMKQSTRSRNVWRTRNSQSLPLTR